MEDVDGNRADRLRLGHRRDDGRRQRPAGRAAGHRAARRLHPHLLHGHAVRGLRRGRRGARTELTPGDHAKKSALFNSGAEAVENAVKIARAYTGAHGGRRLRPRLPRPHQPHDGADRQEHAVQARLRAVRARGLPGAGRPTRSATGRARPAPRPPRRPSTRSASRSAPTNVAAIIIEPILGEGGFIEPAKGFLPAMAGWCRDNGIVFVADEIQTGFCRTGRVVRLRGRGHRPRPDHHRQGHRGRAAARRRHRPRRDHGRRARGRPGRHLRRQPGRLRGRARPPSRR